MWACALVTFPWVRGCLGLLRDNFSLAPFSAKGETMEWFIVVLSSFGLGWLLGRRFMVKQIKQLAFQIAAIEGLSAGAKIIIGTRILKWIDRNE